MKTTQNIFNTKTLPQWIGLGLSVAGIAYYSANSTDILSFSAEPIAKVNNLAASLPLVHSLPTITKVEVEALEDVHKDLSIAQIEAVFREPPSKRKKSTLSPSNYCNSRQSIKFLPPLFSPSFNRRAAFDSLQFPMWERWASCRCYPAPQSILPNENI